MSSQRPPTDPVPPAVPDPPGRSAAAARPGRTDRFRAWVGVLIAVVSILGAVVVWRASVESSNASNSTQQATQQLILQQQRRGSIESGVAQDFRLFLDFQEHVMSWRRLLAQADEAASTDAILAATLRAQARRELSEARRIRPLIQNFDRPSFGDENGVVDFDPARQAHALAEADLELTGLRPDLAFAGAKEAHDRAVRLVGVGVLFAAALLFLTFAQVARRGARRVFALAGVVVLLSASVLFAMVGLA
jgi:hypothetical protein